jgi:mono/diheme cytochrome c family protein
VLKPRLVDAIDALHPEAGRSKPKGRHRPAVQERLGQLQRMAPRLFLVELAIGIAVLASVSVLTQTATADGELRLDAGKPSGEFTATATAADLSGHLQIKPFGVGVSTFTMSFTSPTGEPVDNIEGVRLRAFYDDPNVAPSAGISGTDQDLEATDDPAVWSAESALLTQPGDWRLQARIRRTGVDDAQMTYTVPRVGGILARGRGPEDLFDLPFTYVGWNIVAGGAMIALGIGALLIWRNRPQSWRPAASASVAFSSLIALMAGATLLFGVHGHTGEGTVKNPIPSSPESVAAGYNTFVSNCASCHGFDLRGSSTAADLTVHVPAHNDGTLFLWISEGLPLNSNRKTMPTWKDRLSETERWNVINYLRNAVETGELQPPGTGATVDQTPAP